MPKKVLKTLKIDPVVEASKVDAALEDYKNRDMTVVEIARKYSVCPATLTVWAKKADIPLRLRGRRKHEQPTARQMEIIKMASRLQLDEVGAHFGMHRQSVHRIVKRWRNWAQPSKPPFDPGDRLVWRGKHFTVIDSNRTDGTLVDERGTVYKNFAWNGGRVPRKIGVNPEYVKPNGA